MQRKNNIPLRTALVCVLLFFLFSLPCAQDSTKTAPPVTRDTMKPAPAVATPNEKSDAQSPEKSVVKEDNEDNILIEDDNEELILNDSTLEVNLPAKKTASEVKKAVSEAQPVKKTDSSAVASTPAPNTAAPQTEEGVISETGASKAKDSLGAVTTASVDTTAGKPSQEKKIIIEKERSINFAKNLTEYRSPRKAMLMSLLVPGLGQAYAKKYWKTALYGILEIASIGLAIKFNRDADDQLEKARNYADLNYKFSHFWEFYENFVKFVRDTAASKIPLKDSAKVTEIITTMFGDDITMNEYLDKFYKDKDSSYIVEHSSEIRSEFDDFIRVNNTIAVQGWIEEDPTLIPQMTAKGYIILDTNKYEVYSKKYNVLWILNRKENGAVVDSGVFGYSPKQLEYEKMMGDVKRYSDYSRIFVMLIVVNHVVSAVDAFITAVGYNKRLLNKQSLWQRINLDQQVAVTSTGEIRSTVGFTLRF